MDGFLTYEVLMIRYVLYYILLNIIYYVYVYIGTNLVRRSLASHSRSSDTDHRAHAPDNAEHFPNLLETCHQPSKCWMQPSEA